MAHRSFKAISAAARISTKGSNSNTGRRRKKWRRKRRRNRSNT